MRTYPDQREWETEEDLEYDELETDSGHERIPELQLPPPQPTVGPAFRLACAGGCTVSSHHLGITRCRATLRSDLRLAIGFAERAAALLEQTPRADRTIRLYRQVFGHAPDRRIPWAPRYADSGALTARRFRMASHTLNRRVIHFECRAQPAAHPFRNAAVPPVIGGFPNRNVIWLYPRYWARPQTIRAGILVHEALHLIFLGLFSHSPTERRRINSHCYEWLVLRLNNQTAEVNDLSACRGTPA